MFSSSRSKPKRVERRLLNLLAERHSRAAGLTVASIKNSPLTAGLMSLVIGVAMTLPALLVLISVNLEMQIGKIGDMAEITAYFSNDISDNRVSEISERLHSLFANVEIRYVSAASALAQLSEVMTLKPILNALEYNPLPAALLVRPHEPGVATAREIEQILTNLPEVELVQLDSLWLQRLEAWIGLLNTLSSAVSLVVVSGLLLIINNTIEGGVQSRREEIRITKQLGGTDAYIRRPFLYFGVFLGAAGGTLACLLTAALGHQLGTAVKALALLYQTDFALAGLSFGQNLVVILLGAGIGWLAAFFSVSRKIATFSN
ncbi:MAG: ABC transporter permease [Pseudomonadota bacterium]|nr:ABC transporter permease [Pseudomonadota bacterium]